MFNVKTDFGFVGRLFGVPRAWLSKVGAFCSSWSTHGNIITLERPDNPDPEHAPIKLGIDEEALGEFVDAHGADMGEEPVDNTKYSDLDDFTGNNVLPDTGSVADWQSGGENGVRLQLFAPVKYTESGVHLFYPVVIDISKSGKIVKIEFTRNKGIEIGA